MGNFPMERTDLVEILKESIQKYNKTVVISSQWREGCVKESYASWAELK